jgi:hypothetical protein
MREAKMTVSQESPVNRLCSVVSKAAGDDPGGSGTPFDGYLGIEVAPPWKDDVTESPNFPEGLWDAVERVWDAGVIGKFTGLLPDPEYSREGHVRVMLMRRPPGLAARYEKAEYVVPKAEVVALVESLLEPEGTARFERYAEDTSNVRDILVCTHGANDACCGKFGYPVYDLLRFKYAAENPGPRVWRTSHIGGHRFAPTLIDFPEGRYWGHLEPEHVEDLVLRRGPASELAPHCRGLASLGRPFEQLVEREILSREGWAWTGYAKRGETLSVDENEDRAEVRIEYESPAGERGVYEAPVEASGSVMTLGASGTDPLQEVKQYRVVGLKKLVYKD